MLHNNQRVIATDRYFVLGGNPSGDGGGVIGSRNSLVEACELQREAIKRGYLSVKVMDWKEMMGDDC